MKTVEQIDNQIAQYEGKIKQLMQERKKIIQMDPDCKLAEQMHSMFCTGNHTDGCDWHYGSWDKPTWAHKEWLEKAKKAREQGLTIEKMQEVYELTRG